MQLSGLALIILSIQNSCVSSEALKLPEIWVNLKEKSSNFQIFSSLK
jgi:hypothetical protein